MPFVGNFGPTELIILLVIALVVLGPGKLPEVGSALGRSIREFRKAATDVKEATSIEPVKATAPVAVPAQAAPVAAPAPAAPVVPPAMTVPSGEGPVAQTAVEPAIPAEPVAAAPVPSDTDAPAS